MSQAKSNKNTMYGVVGIGILAIIYMIWVMTARHSATVQGWTPTPASNLAAGTDWVFNFINMWSYAFFVGVVGAMGWLLWKYWRKSNTERTEKVKDNIVFEMFWVIFPTLLCLVVFILGARDYVEHRTPPPNAYEIQATASQWAWNFTYPDGRTSNDLYIPADQPIRLVISSVDVLHSLYIPHFRVKMDAVPGRYTTLWFQAKQSTSLKWVDLDAVESATDNGDGSYNVSNKGKSYRYVQPHRLFCTEYCGKSHSAMDRKVFVLPRDRWNAVLDSLNIVPETAESGKNIYTNKCVACHSVDGSPMAGPTWKGMFGHSVSTSAGTVDVNEDYIRESILDPTAKIVTGFAGTMPSFAGQIKDAEINALIAYMKELK
jgi:cytochrome c oxidase subunit 2